MQINAFKLRALKPPKDDLRAAIKAARLRIKEGDIVCISSKVVSIDEGRCIPIEGAPEKERLIEQEADWYLKAPKTSRWRSRYTVNKGLMVGSAGIDESNASGHYVLFPQDPFKSARAWRAWIKQEYGVNVATIITDSTSTPLRRGAIGIALAWDGIDPLRDYRGMPDIFGRTIKIELADLVDALAAAAVLEMGEGAEQTPIAIIRDAKNIVYKNRSPKADQLIVQPEDDVFAPLLFAKQFKWKRKGRK